MKPTHAQPRNKDSGKFGFENRFDRLCRCGHRLGAHAADAPHPCFNEDSHLESATGESCSCEKFQPAKTKRSA